MTSSPSISFEAFAAVLAANGYSPDEAKLHSLYAVLPTIEALQARVRQATAEMALEPAHIFRGTATSAPSGEAE